MIQRIQTLYLLASLCVLTIFFFIPLGVINIEPAIEYSAMSFKISETGEVIKINYLLIISMVIAMILHLVTIFLFKNRRIQMLLAQISLVVLLAFTVGTFLFNDITTLVVNEQTVTEPIEFDPYIGLLIFPWIFTYLALRAIRKDEALVRSADRMR